MLDPRIKTPRLGLAQQFTLSTQTAAGMTESFDALEQLGKLRAQVKDLRARAGLAPAISDALAALDRRAAALEGDGGQRGPAAATGSGPPGLSQIHASLATLLDVLQQADATPTTQAVAASQDLQQKLRALMSGWTDLKSRDVQALNAQLRAANLPPLAF
jgi:hypothetical protein